MGTHDDLKSMITNVEIFIFPVIFFLKMIWKWSVNFRSVQIRSDQITFSKRDLIWSHITFLPNDLDVIWHHHFRDLTILWSCSTWITSYRFIGYSWRHDSTTWGCRGWGRCNFWGRRKWSYSRILRTITSTFKEIFQFQSHSVGLVDGRQPQRLFLRPARIKAVSRFQGCYRWR